MCREKSRQSAFPRYIFHMAEVKASSETGWWLVVERLKDAQRSSEEIVELLESAVAAAESDAAWSHSGIMELLRRAKDQAKSGHAPLGARSAIGLLGFHQTALKLKSSSSNVASEGESHPVALSESQVSSRFGDLPDAPRSSNALCICYYTLINPDSSRLDFDHQRAKPISNAERNAILLRNVFFSIPHY